MYLVFGMPLPDVYTKIPPAMDEQVSHPTESVSSFEEGIRDENWRLQAECRGLSPAIFIDKLDGRLRKDWGEVPIICKRCVVKKECLKEALDLEDVWMYRGCTTPFERVQMLYPDYRSDIKDERKRRHLLRRLLERMRKGGIPMQGRNCELCGSTFDAKSGVQRKCGECD